MSKGGTLGGVSCESSTQMVEHHTHDPSFSEFAFVARWREGEIDI